MPETSCKTRSATYVSDKKTLEFLKAKGISLDNALIPDFNNGQRNYSYHAIRGIYGFFAIKGTEEQCFYVGKSGDIFSRMIKGHLKEYYYFLNPINKADSSNTKQYTEVTGSLNEYLAAGYQIEVRVLTRVDYDPSMPPQYNANLLVFEELKAILYYQKNGQCMCQYHEGAKRNERRYLEKTHPQSTADPRSPRK